MIKKGTDRTEILNVGIKLILKLHMCLLCSNKGYEDTERQNVW